MTQLAHLKTALVYDQATTAYGGAELVLTQLHQLFPSAPLFTLFHDPRVARWTHGWDVRTSGLQWLYSLIRRHEPLTVLAPLAFEAMSKHLHEFDLVISVSSSTAKGILTLPHQLHVCYLLTPTRYLTQLDNEYLDTYFLHKVARVLRIDRPIKKYVARWDQVAARRPDKVIAISQLVKTRIAKQYGYKADAVVYPPIPSHKKAGVLAHPYKRYILCISRLVWYKRIDLAIQAVIGNPALPALIIVGTGAAAKKLHELTGSAGYVRGAESIEQALQTAHEKNVRIIFLGSCDEADKNALLQHCAGLIMPGVEDYGLTAVEAASHGIGSVISSQSGVAEILTHPHLAIHLESETVKAVNAAIVQLLKHPPKPSSLKKHAQHFDQTAFLTDFSESVRHFWKSHSQSMSIPATSIHSLEPRSLIQSAP